MSFSRWLIGLCCCGISSAQTAPVITHVVTSGLLDTNFAGGSEVYIFGTFAFEGAGRDYTISVGNASGGINVAATTQFIIAAIPMAAPTGQQSLTVTYQGKASNSIPITINAAAPEFAGTGVTITGGMAAPQYGPYEPFTHFTTSKPVTPGSPAMPGEAISSRVYGLGSSSSPTVTLTVAGQNVPLAMPVTAGASSIDFFLPSNVPAGIDPVIVTVNGVASNTASLPVGTAPFVGALLNGASFGSAGVAAAGSIVSLFGDNLGTQNALTGFPATSANGVTVFFGSTPAPIFALAATGGQVNVLVPDELPTSGMVNVTVQTPGGTSPAYPVQMAAAAPGIFFYTDPEDPTRHNAVAVLANTAWIAMPLSMAPNFGIPSNCSAQKPATLCGQPAHPGDYLQIYATGLGAATPNGDPNGAVLPTGTVAPAGGNPLYATTAVPTVTVGGQNATVLFSGIAPGYAGLYQVDIQIPANAPVGDDVPLTISMAGNNDTATVALVAH